MRAPRVVVSCPDYASLLRLMGEGEVLGVLPHPALLLGAKRGQVVPPRLRETLPRYEMHVFTPVRPRRAVMRVVEALCQSLTSGAASPAASSRSAP